MRMPAILLTLMALTTTPAVAAPQTVELLADLPQLAFPRDLLVDAQGEVCVATWHNVTRVSPDGELSDLLLDNLLGTTSHLVMEDTGALLVAERGIFTGFSMDNRVLRITPDGQAVTIIDKSGDGLGHTLLGPGPLAIDAAGNAIVCGSTSDNVFRVTSTGLIQQILSPSQAPVAIDTPQGITVDSAGNVLVSFGVTDNVVSISPAGVVTELLDSTGDGLGNGLDNPAGMCADATGAVYVAGTFSRNVLRVDADGTVTEVMDATGDGITALQVPSDVALDASGNLYVLTFLRKVFKRTPAGVVSALFGSGGFGVGEGLVGTPSMAVAPDGTVYVTSDGSNTLYRIAPDGTITEWVQRQDTMITMVDLAVASDGTAYLAGAGSDNVLSVSVDGSIDTFLRADQLGPATPMGGPRALDTDSADALYIGSFGSNNVLRVTNAPVPVVTEVVSDPGFMYCLDVAVDSTGVVFSSWREPGAVLRTEPGGAPSLAFDLAEPRALDVDASGAVYAVARDLDSVTRQSVTGVLSTLIGPDGDGVHPLDRPTGLAVMPDGTTWVTGSDSQNVFRIDRDGTITQVMDASGDGKGHVLQKPEAVVFDSQGNVYVLCWESRNLFQVSQHGDITLLMDESGDGLGHGLVKPDQLAIDAQDRLYVADPDTNRLFRLQPPSTWKNLGGASPAGAFGEPTLTAAGSLTSGSAMKLTLVKVPPRTPVLLWLAFDPKPYPALGGTVWAWPYDVQRSVLSHDNGVVALGLTWPAGIPPGIELTLQCVVQDTGVPAGITLSNAVRAVTP